MKMAKVKVNNVPDYAKEAPYWVVRKCDGELWFYGAWSDEKTANHIALQVDGLVVENEGAE
jgi:hypothetical protein